MSPCFGLEVLGYRDLRLNAAQLKSPLQTKKVKVNAGFIYQLFRPTCVQGCQV